MRVLISVSLTLAGCVFSARADEVAMLPLGDPARAFVVASAAAGEFVDCRDLAAKGPLAFEAMIADLAKADVVLIGEHHSNIAGHRVEQRVFDALAETGRPLVLGMEFFEIDDDAALARYVAGATDTNQMIAETNWYGTGGTNYNFGYYRPMVEKAKAKGFAVHGVNVTRELVRAVSKKGYADLPPEQKALVPDPGAVSEKHRYVVDRMMGGMAAAMPEMFDSMYRGQTMWDSAMAASVLRIRSAAGAAKPLVVVIVGVGHVGHGLGIPARLRAADPSLDVRVIAPVVAEKPDEDARLHPGFVPKETASFSRGFGEYVYILPDTGGELAYPQFGMRLSQTPAATGAAPSPVELAGITPGSIAERAGLRKGDRLLAINDAPVSTVDGAAILLSTLSWDSIASVSVSRGTDSAKAPLVVPVAILPPTDGDDDWLKSRTDSSLLDTFEPTSDRAFPKPSKDKPKGVHSRLVTFDGKPVRIDVMNGTVLMQSWKLDDSGRPVLGLFPAGAADGAVRVELTRDEAGKVTGTKRLNTKGEELAAP